jgi:S-phase kinase-associated protein 1
MSSSLSIENESSLSLDPEVTQDENEVITLTSNDNVSFTCTYKEIKCSNMLVSAFTDSKNNETKENDDNNIILSNIDGKTLNLIVKFLKEHNGVEPPLPEKPVKSKDMKEITTEWMANFVDDIVKDNKESLYKVISAANYLFINSLLHICCAKIASMIKGIPLEEIKDELLPKK